MRRFRLSILTIAVLYLPTLSLALGSGPATLASSQADSSTPARSGWTETFYSELYPTYTSVLYSLLEFQHDGDPCYGILELTAQDYFIISGATTQEPPWRLTFANLANNHWTYSQEFYFFFNQGTNRISVYRDYTAGFGINSFIRDPLASAPERLAQPGGGVGGGLGPQTSRSLSSEVTSSLSYTLGW